MQSDLTRQCHIKSSPSFPLVCRPRSQRREGVGKKLTAKVLGIRRATSLREARGLVVYLRGFVSSHGFRFYLDEVKEKNELLSTNVFS